MNRGTARRIRLYWETLRHLRPVQLYGRLWFAMARPRPDLVAPPPERARIHAWTRPACRTPSLISPDEFLLLGERGRLSEVGWDGDQKERLWRYNQHYFDDLNALDSHAREGWHRQLIPDWIEHNPPGVGTGWEPYPTSLRIVNWLKWALEGNSLPNMASHSLAIQARWLMRRLEFHLLGNHLLANAKALMMAGLSFHGVEAERWYRTGRSIFERELPEQILSDGGHFERSPMYHLLILEDLLDLLNVHRCFDFKPPDSWTETIERMRTWARVMQHPDGEIAFFNDAAFGIAPLPAEIESYAARLGMIPTEGAQAMVWLKDSGYTRILDGRACVIADIAPIGPDYLPGHGHADTLSFELSLNGRRVVVNGGTSVYGRSSKREYQRSTEAHAALVIDGQNSSEVWSGFRVARRARLLDANAWNDGGRLGITGMHNGYTRLRGSPLHRRTWLLQCGMLQVTDEVVGEGVHQMAAVFPLAPDLVPVKTDGSCVEILDGESVMARFEFEPSSTGEIHLERTSWHPRFGEDVPSWRIRRVVETAIPAIQRTTIRWRDL